MSQQTHLSVLVSDGDEMLTVESYAPSFRRSTDPVSLVTIKSSRTSQSPLYLTVKEARALATCLLGAALDASGQQSAHDADQA